MLFRIILLVLALLILVPSTGFAQAEGEFGTWPFPESVDQLPKELCPGETFNGFPNRQRNIDWMAIPEWMAGEWLSGDLRIMKSFDHVSGKFVTIPTSTHAPIADHFGDQYDKQGTVWSCNFTPFIVNMKMSDQLMDSQETIGMKALEVRDDQVALWQRVFHVLYYPHNNVIHDSYTEERVTEFAPQAPGMMMAQCTSKFFDANGDARTTTNSMRITRQTKAFRPGQQRVGINLPASLSEYFQATGRGELIP